MNNYSSGSSFSISENGWISSPFLKRKDSSNKIESPSLKFYKLHKSSCKTITSETFLLFFTSKTEHHEILYLFFKPNRSF